MRERGLTLRQVGQMAGVRASVVQNWIEGKNPHDLRAVSRLAKAVGVEFKSLLLGERESREEPMLLSEFYEEREHFSGLCRISIHRLLPRGKSE